MRAALRELLGSPRLSADSKEDRLREEDERRDYWRCFPIHGVVLQRAEAARPARLRWQAPEGARQEANRSRRCSSSASRARATASTLRRGNRWFPRRQRVHPCDDVKTEAEKTGCRARPWPEP
jgi:hypothetical protein